MTETSETYSMPSHGWTCFHCGETFKTPGAARDHFGFTQASDPACRIKLGAERGLLMALRKAEQELAECRAEAPREVEVIAREMARLQARHADALKAAEELGFERGVADMRKHGWQLAEQPSNFLDDFWKGCQR